MRGGAVSRLGLMMLTAIVATASFAAPRRPSRPTVTLAEVDAAYADYNFDEADRLLSQYDKGRTKEMIERDGDVVDAYRNRILLARNMMERVEKITIVDSLTVDADRFFSAMRLAVASGSLTDASALPAKLYDGHKPVSPVYSTENGDVTIWMGYDEKEERPNFACYRSSKLADGSTEPTERLFDHASIFPDGKPGRLATPYLMSDGMTLYFAADGDASIGGLDIFLARATGDGGYLQPANVGMPYNSPADDYMMAIDEVTGFGWWATERNAPEGKVTIYVFLPSEMRVNYPADTPDLSSLAMLRSIADMRENEPTAKERLKILEDKRIMRRETVSEVPFTLALPDGRVLTSLNDFRNPTARLLMTRRMGEQRAFDEAESQLEKMRTRYGKGEKALADEIIAKEAALEQQRKALNELTNEIVAAECPDN